MKRILKIVTFTAAIIPLYWAGMALASPPASVVGYWSLLSGQTQEDLEITRQDSYPAGACEKIIGTIRGIAPIHGIYCPDTGRIQMVHENVATNYTVRVFTGNLAEEVYGQPLRMAGTFTVLYQTFGTFGEYGFSASQ